MSMESALKVSPFHKLISLSIGRSGAFCLVLMGSQGCRVLGSVVYARLI